MLLNAEGVYARPALTLKVLIHEWTNVSVYLQCTNKTYMAQEVFIFP